MFTLSDNIVQTLSTLFSQLKNLEQCDRKPASVHNF